MKILIATDGSDYSTAAIEECCRSVIRPENAEVLIVSAFDDSYPITAEPFALSAEYYQKIETAVKEQAASFVEDAQKIVRGRFPAGEFVVSTEVLRGAPDQQIIEKAKTIYSQCINKKQNVITKVEAGSLL